MTNVLNRALQLKILDALAQASPGQVDGTYLSEILAMPGCESDSDFLRQLWYLDQHELIDAKFLETFSDGIQFAVARITHKGLDFLQDDGGLTAMLGVVTVRFEQETLQALLLSRVEGSTAEPEVKSRIKTAILDGGADLLKEATKGLLELAWKNGPEAIRLLQTLAN